MPEWSDANTTIAPTWTALPSEPLPFVASWPSYGPWDVWHDVFPAWFSVPPAPKLPSRRREQRRKQKRKRQRRK